MHRLCRSSLCHLALNKLFIFRNIYGSSVCVYCSNRIFWSAVVLPQKFQGSVKIDVIFQSVCVCWEWLFMQKVSNKLGDQFHQKVRFLILENCPQIVSISFTNIFIDEVLMLLNWTVLYKHKWFSISPILMDLVSRLVVAPKSKNKQHLAP